MQSRKLEFPSISTQRCPGVFYAGFGRLLVICAGEESAFAEQADNLLERGEQRVCSEGVISICDDARARVALALFVCACVRYGGSLLSTIF